MSFSVQQMADRVAELMEQRLGVRGADLSAKLKRGGRYLPTKVLGAAQFLALAAEQSHNPRFLPQIDPERTAIAYDMCVRYLKPLGKGARRTAMLWSILGSLAAVILVTGAMILAVLVWRGYVPF